MSASTTGLSGGDGHETTDVMVDAIGDRAGGRVNLGAAV